MSDTITFGFEYLFAEVKARFLAEEDATPHLWGWREPSKQMVTGPRVIWVPGDDATGDIGKIGAPRKPGGNPRPLVNLDEIFTLYCVSGSIVELEDEKASYHTARLLFTAVLRAIALAVGGYGNCEITSARWDHHRRKERRWGAAIRALVMYPNFVPDFALPVVPSDAKASITTQLNESTPDSPPIEVPE